MSSRKTPKKSRAGSFGRTIQSVDRALMLLEIVVAEDTPLSLSELGRRSGLPVQTVQSLLRTLQAHELVSQSGRGAPYGPGPGLALLRGDLPSRRERALLAAGPVRELATHFGEAVLLGELSGARLITLASAAASRLLGVRTEGYGKVYSELHVMATGKILLAYLPSGRREALLGSLALRAKTDRTITDLEDFRRQLDHVRQCGYAETVDEDEIGVAALGVPVRGAAGRVSAALGLCLPTVRYSQDRREVLLAGLRGAAAQVETAWAGTE